MWTLELFTEIRGWISFLMAKMSTRRGCVCTGTYTYTHKMTGYFVCESNDSAIKMNRMHTEGILYSDFGIKDSPPKQIGSVYCDVVFFTIPSNRISLSSSLGRLNFRYFILALLWVDAFRINVNISIGFCVFSVSVFFFGQRTLIGGKWK